MPNNTLSVIIPAYNEEGNIPLTSATLSATLTQAHIPYELIFVDDGSRDNTWPEIQQAALTNPHIRGVRFSRNFGKESAMFAGLFASKGACALIIDCDLQHPADKIPLMYQLWQDGYQVVEGKKTTRGKESFSHSLGAKIFYKTINKILHFDMTNTTDFKLLDRQVVDELLKMEEKNAFFRALSSWVGFKTTTVEFQIQERTVGKSKWSTYALFKYAVHNITAFSTAPMQLITLLGALMLLSSLLLGINSLYQKFSGIALDGFTTVILLQLFTGSIIMISLGLIGYYIARIYDEVQNRPRYIISETCGGTSNEA